MEGQQQFPVIASILGARLNRETLLEPEMRQEKKVKESFLASFKNKQTNKQALPLSQSQYYEMELALAISLKLSQSWIKVSIVSTVEKTGNFGCDDSLKELSCLLWFVKFSFAKFISLVSYFTEMVIVITETIQLDIYRIKQSTNSNCHRGTNRSKSP